MKYPPDLAIRCRFGVQATAESLTEATLFRGIRPGKVAPAGQSCRSRLRTAIPSGDRAPSYKRPRHRQQIVDAHPVRAYFSTTRKNDVVISFVAIS